MSTAPRSSAFLSYAKVDDSHGEIEAFRQRLIDEIRIVTGEDFRIFSDEDLTGGENWTDRLAEELERAGFLIAILTPSYFRSENCRRELEAFLEREQRLGREDLILPVYFVDAPDVTHEVFSRIYVDFRKLRFEPQASPAVRQAYAQLASNIQERLRRHPAGSTGEEYWTLDSLTLRDFRCFQELKLGLRHKSSLGGNWTCLAGINGAGKSSILQAIAIALMGTRSADLQSGVLARLPRRTDELPTAQIEFDATERHTGRTVTGQAVSITERGRCRTRGELLAERPVVERSIVVAYGATRNLASEKDEVVQNMVPEAQRVAGLFYPLSKLATADVLLSDRRRSSSFAGLFSALMKRVFDRDIAVSYHDKGLSLRAVSVRRSGIGFRVSGGDLIEAIDLPDGFRSSAAWMADLCATWCDTHAKQAEDADPSAIEAIVLIDEIDLHLHPALQRELVPRLREALPKVQWVVTTHSPLVLANFDANEIIALDRNADGNIRRLDRQILGFTSDEIYNWLMGTSPTGAAMEAEIQKADQGEGRSREEMARLMRVSPEKSEEEAREQLEEFQEILKSLKPKK